eukprot:5221441-Alexandrium_andersonii.AAC.1
MIGCSNACMVRAAERPVWPTGQAGTVTSWGGVRRTIANFGRPPPRSYVGLMNGIPVTVEHSDSRTYKLA